MTIHRFQAMSRRGFVALCPAGLAVPGLMQLDSLSPLKRAGADGTCAWRTATRVAAGYWRGSEAWPQGRTEPDSSADLGEVVDPAALPAGDPRFAERGLRLALRGMQVPAGLALDALAPISLSLETHADVPTEVLAWQFENRFVANVGSPVRFDWPVAAEEGLVLNVEVAGSQHRLRLSLGRDAGVPKLRRGVYLLAWQGPGMARLPSWRRLALRAEPAGEEDADPLDRLGLTQRRDGRAADLACLVLSADFAEEEVASFEGAADEPA